ncbi:MAG: hypothetical protein N2439_10925 [Anaerolineae bacterium]|nr:hypothetical protein [Anaerolineae bacterium]
MIVAGILLLAAGVIFPLALLLWLSSRLSRPPALAPRRVGLWLAFNFVLPVGLVLWGLRLLSPRVAASAVLHDAAVAALIAAGLLAVVLALDGR